MNLIEGLLKALEAEHAHIEKVRGDFNSAFHARQRAAAIVNRLTELTEELPKDPHAGLPGGPSL